MCHLSQFLTGFRSWVSWAMKNSTSLLLNHQQWLQNLTMCLMSQILTGFRRWVSWALKNSTSLLLNHQQWLQKLTMCLLSQSLTWSNGKVFEIKEKSAYENKGIHLLLSLTLWLTNCTKCANDISAILITKFLLMWVSMRLTKPELTGKISWRGLFLKTYYNKYPCFAW